MTSGRRGLLVLSCLTISSVAAQYFNDYDFAAFDNATLPSIQESHSTISLTPNFSECIEEPDVKNGWWIWRTERLEAFPHGTRVYFTCNTGFSSIKKMNRYLLTCSNGNWEPDPQTVCTVSKAEPKRQQRPLTSLESWPPRTKHLNFRRKYCPVYPVEGNVVVKQYLVSRLHESRPYYQPGSLVILCCPSHGQVLLPHGTQRRECLANGTWDRPHIKSYCVNPDGCPLPPVLLDVQFRYEIHQDCHLKDGDEAQCIYTELGLVKPETKIILSCKDEGSYLVGDYIHECEMDFRWHPLRWPVCKRPQMCRKPATPQHGFHLGDDSDYEFLAGQELSFHCLRGYQLQGPASITCQGDGTWNSDPPFCQKTGLWTNKRLVAMGVAGLLLGLLLVVLLIFLIQRQLLIRRAQARRRRLIDVPSEPRLSAEELVAASRRRAENGGQRLSAGDSWVDPDRLALIAFADSNAMLPSYEEAMSEAISSRRGPPPFDAISTLSGYASRAVRRLPSVSSLRSREAVPGVSRPTGTQHSSTSGSVVSHIAPARMRDGAGSADTMATTSEASTAVTLDTVSSGTGHTSSTRAQAGSLTSVYVSEHNGSIEGVPLLEAVENHGSVEQLEETWVVSHPEATEEGADNSLEIEDDDQKLEVKTNT